MDYLKFVSSRGYQLIDPIALDKLKGVYKCRHNEMNEEFVLKWIKWDGDESEYRQLMREKEICVTLEHQNVVKFVEFFESPLVKGISSYFYQVMELCRSDLSDWFEDNRSRSLEVCDKMVNEIISGLSYLHSNNIMHRDLKPQNILISNEGICKLADFGLVKKHITTVTKGNTNAIGTELYAAPELRLSTENLSAVSKGKYNLKVDVYSLAIILLEFFTIFNTPKEIEIAIQNYKTFGWIPDNFFENFDKNTNSDYFIILKDLIVKMIKSDPKFRPHLNEVKQCFHNIHLKVKPLRKEMLLLFAKYSVFNQIDSELIISSQFVHIYSRKIYEYLILLNNEKERKIYEIRVNEEFNTILEKKRIIKELSNKTIIDIACGAEHVICLADNSHVFAWGNNRWGQLGNGTRVDNNVPTIVEKLTNKNIVSISCGECHSLAMSINGKVYAWGENVFGQLGVGSKRNYIPVPTVIAFDSQLPFLVTLFPFLNNRKITAISCGLSHSLALTENGSVFSWGWNKDNRCGHHRRHYYRSAKRVKLEKRMIITKICCGPHHSLLLTSEGDVWSFGWNHCGQLGRHSDDNNDNNTVLKIESSVKFIDIYSNMQQNISIGLSESRKCFVWGECGEEKVLIARETQFESINETILFYSNIKIIPKAIMF